jgi:hypothetical protein
VGYWSILSSVDEMDDNSNFEISMVGDEAMQAVETALTRPGRVVCQRISDTDLLATTVKQTPAWAYAGLVVLPIGIVLLASVRVERIATIRFDPSPHGVVLRVRGQLDTKAASRLRALRTDAGAPRIPAAVQ